MKLYEYVIKLNDRASKYLKGITRESTRTSRGLLGVTRSADMTSRSLGRLKTVVASALAGFGAARAIQDIRDVTAEVQGLRNAINFASGSDSLGAKNLKYVKKLATDYGLALKESYQGYLTISGATKGTSLQGKGTMDIFKGVSMASTVMQLSADRYKGALIALGQIMSKGKVQAEELRGQLGERIPGAFQIAARAMNMTTKQLDKFMSMGKLTAEEFLPRFAKQLEKEFSGGLNKSSISLRAITNRMNNQILLTKVFLGEKLMPVLVQGSIAFTNLLKWIRANWDMITRLVKIVSVAAITIGVYKGTILATIFITKSWILITKVARIVLMTFTYGFKVLNKVMRLNPIGLVITLIAGLAAGFVYAYNKVDGFRGVIWGVWEAIKQFGSNIGDFMKKTMLPFVETWAAIKDGRWGDALKSLGVGIVSTLTLPHQVAFNVLNGSLTKGLVSAYSKGHAKGVAAEGIKMPGILKKALGLGQDSGGLAGGIPSGDLGDSTTTYGLDNITGGGKSIRNVTVNIDQLVDRIVVHARDLREGAEDIRRIVEETLIKAVGGAEEVLSNG